MISIVSGYYNRKQLFHETLKTIKKSEQKDIEFIVVDDGSDPAHRLESLTSEFPFLKIVRIEKDQKWYINPCVTFNIGIRKAKGDIIVLQNPECIHVHDVLTYIVQNIDDSKYISISAYGLDPELTARVPYHRANGTLPEFLNKLPQQAYIGGTTNGWYNHSVYRPVHFHFCAAMTRKNMEQLNGFDERFAHGVGYDDDEIIVRIRKMGVQTVIADSVSVFHQYHPTLWTAPNTGQLCEMNRIILDTKTRVENNFRAPQSPLWNGI